MMEEKGIGLSESKEGVGVTNNNYHQQYHHNNHSNRGNHNNHYRNNHNNNNNNQIARFQPPRQEHFHHQAAVVSEDILQFWRCLGVRVNNSSTASGRGGGGRVQPIIDVNSHNDVSMWMRIWGAAAMGAGKDDDQIILIRAFLLVPDAINLTPPCDGVIDVLLRVVTYVHRECGQQQARAPLRGDHIVYFSSALENVVDIVRNRLMSKINLVVQPNVASLTVERLADPFHESTMALLMATHGKDERMPRLLTREIDIKTYAEALKKDANERPGRNVEASGSTEDAVTGRRRDVRWNDWTRPTVGWLMSDSCHKTDELRSKYRDSEEYANTLARLWTVLTFYWGSGAVWQKCRCQSRGSENQCGEPLLTVTEGGRCSFKSSNGQSCHEPAAFRCHRRGHDEICLRCLIARQEANVGPPGLHASTDIYDAVVERETTRREGVVFVLSYVQSRRPPRIDPNWNTTYRLQASALVAVVKLGVSREPLLRDRPMQWAEVVNIDPKDSRAESGHRNAGRVALRLLTRGDIPALSADVESPLEVRGPVAIIDLRVFVPEVVSVLATLTNETFTTNLSNMPCIGRLIGHPPTCPPGFVYNPGTGISDFKAVVLQAINNSEIEFLHRLDGQKRRELANQICALPPVRSLYGTQLEAFSSALATSIHCTQGPPGTGKSYIGVCLVLALDIIRREAQKAGQAVGPVVILSYKNHALDEFLDDVVKASNLKNIIVNGKRE